MNATAYVYRFYDAQGCLLYVGSTSRLRQRISYHKRVQPWADQIATLTTKPYRNRYEADRAEKLAIQTENPKYNIAREFEVVA